ncbi:hypothetical protein KUTeg_022802 [Tegillarca granosa]|uniref:Uncharacterized protein n=1 Tax=Tegillarca granosa TaxID=220873 RepID=A0ABQ9E4E4_TEGGR|nr:hypothetical protein KUTeg_022802 [Tegillarca granosa]
MKILIGLAVLSFVMCQTDHLLLLLKAMHASHSYQALPPEEKVIAAELLAAAEVDQITHYVDQLGFVKLLQFLDHVNKINATEAHLLERYLEQELNQEIRPQTTLRKIETMEKRDLQTVLKTLQANPAYQNLTQSDKDLMEELVTTAERGRLTPVVLK